MKLLPSSLAGRLLVAAAAFIVIAFVVAYGVMGTLLHRFVQHQVDERLDSEILALSSMVQRDADGTLRIAGNADGPPFDQPGHGWYWQIERGGTVLRSKSLGAATLELPDLPVIDFLRPQPAEARGPRGEPLHLRLVHRSFEGAPIVFIATSPHAAVDGPLREVMTALGLSLAILGAILVGAAFLQVQLGLRPLSRLRKAIAAVRSGAAEAIPADQPLEVRPLVWELNSLLRQNSANLERARRHVANLAHGLKTPLATLSLSLKKIDTPASAEQSELVDAMEARIRHHLTRARTAVLAGPVRAQTNLGVRIDDMLLALAKVHADANIAVATDLDRDLSVACEREDLDEMLGNILDNAFKWARAAIRVETCAVAAEALISVKDDGPGLSEADIESALQPGRRLDEAMLGYGFGLPIARELTELYGGRFHVESSANGLQVTIALPRARSVRNRLAIDA